MMCSKRVRMPVQLSQKSGASRGSAPGTPSQDGRPAIAENTPFAAADQARCRAGPRATRAHPILKG